MRRSYERFLAWANQSVKHEVAVTALGFVLCLIAGMVALNLLVSWDKTTPAPLPDMGLGAPVS